MTLLATLLPMLTAGTEFTFNVTQQADAVRVVTIPKVKDFKPDTDDAELAALQAALSQPLVFTIPADADLDAEFARLLTQAAGIRQATTDQLVAYQDAQRQAQQTATAEAAKKSAKKEAAKKPASAPAKPPKAAPAQEGSSEPVESGGAVSLDAMAGTSDGDGEAAKPEGSLNLFGEDAQA